MKYRTVAVYPQVDQQIDKAIQHVISGQMPAEDAMSKRRTTPSPICKRAGVKL